MNCLSKAAALHRSRMSESLCKGSETPPTTEEEILRRSGIAWLSSHLATVEGQKSYHVPRSRGRRQQHWRLPRQPVITASIVPPSPSSTSGTTYDIDGTFMHFVLLTRPATSHISSILPGTLVGHAPRHEGKCLTDGPADAPGYNPMAVGVYRAHVPCVSHAMPADPSQPVVKTRIKRHPILSMHVIFL